MSKIVHFDVPADDMERAKGFYEGLFGWKIEKAPGPMEYFLIDTDGLAGGIGKRGAPEQAMTNYVEVKSLSESVAKVKDLGGTVTQERMPVPAYGYLAVCADTEGNVFGLMEKDETAA